MAVTTGILVYVILWWITFFMVLPWGIKPNEAPEKGWQLGAPTKTNLKTKLIATTVVASILFYILYLYVPTDMMQWAIFKES